MKTFKELKEAINNKQPLKWNDPQPIIGNNYKITFIEDLSDISEDEDVRGYPILIQYGDCSEAEVLITEIELS